MGNDLKPISSGELFDENLTYITGKKDFNSYFSHYTGKNNANSILKSKSLWASPINKTNDENEKSRYPDENVFILCFCSSNREKIPMWYLYAGVIGEGVRLTFTKTKMRDFINGIDTIYPVIEHKIQEKKALHKNIDFNLTYGWVYYYQKDKSIVKYKNKKYLLSDSYEKLRYNNFLIKDYEWYYESEFRIVIELKDKNIKCDGLAIMIEPKDFKITLAPEYSLQKKEELKKLDGFKEYPSNLDDSKLKINMQLVGSEDKAIEVCQRIAGLNYCAKKQETV